jgi:hypothetical protein
MIEDKVRQALVIGLGREGELTVEAFRERLAERFDEMPLIGLLVITDEENPPAVARSVHKTKQIPVRRIFISEQDIRLEDLKKNRKSVV